MKEYNLIGLAIAWPGLGVVNWYVNIQDLPA
jgi:hypothetical protein